MNGNKMNMFTPTILRNNKQAMIELKDLHTVIEHMCCADDTIVKRTSDIIRTDLYSQLVYRHMKEAFPGLESYNRYVIHNPTATLKDIMLLREHKVSSDFAISVGDTINVTLHLSLQYGIFMTRFPIIYSDECHYDITILTGNEDDDSIILNDILIKDLPSKIKDYLLLGNFKELEILVTLAH